MTTTNIVIVTKGEDAVSNQAAELDAVTRDVMKRQTRVFS